MKLPVLSFLCMLFLLPGLEGQVSCNGSNGSSCDDGDPCTINDTCFNGVCIGTPLNCDDGNPCTLDECIDGNCVNTPLNGLPCDDGNPCTVNDVCVNGVCQGTPLNCDDGNPCTDDNCVPGMGCISTAKPEGTPCDDGDPCTENDQCINGICSGTPVVCDDGDPCTINDTCINGDCVGTPLNCDDGNPCTLDECIDGNCVNTPLNGLPCDDGNPCTVNDVCVNGVCQGTPLNCDDGNPCTDDNCVPGMGCVSTAKPEGTPCDDGDPCTINDTCINGDCVGTPLNCDDGNPCTLDECIDGNCVNTPLNGLPCDDGNPCTVNDKCVNGICQGTPKICDDGDPCTLDECDPVIGCVSTPVLVSQYLVVSSADTGPGSLRDIVSAACNGDSIYFAQGLDTIRVSSDINLEVNLNFIGNGPTSTIISGESVTRVFNIASEAEIKMMKLGIINGFESNDGGAILNHGMCTLRNVLLEHNFESSTPKAFTNLGSLEIIAGTVVIR